MSSFYGGGLILDQSGGSSGGAKIYSKTKQEWNSQRDLVSEKDTFYIYTNYKQTEDGKDIPGIKVGDGNAYLIDKPFIAAGEQSLDQLYEHIRNAAIHVSTEDRQSWNNVNDKVTARISSSDPQNIIFSFN